MSAFLLLGIFPQLPTIFFLTFIQEHAFPFDVIGGLIIIVLLFIELAIGAFAMKSLILRQTAHFYRLCQEESPNGMLDNFYLCFQKSN
jgi:hypothetical protein